MRPKGSIKTPGSGRKKGSVNTKTQYRIESIEEILERNGVNPFDILSELAKDPDKTMRFQASKELAQYVLPKKRDHIIQAQIQTELTAKIDHSIVAEFDTIIQARLNERRSQSSSS